jgi:hypothetical protein
LPRKSRIELREGPGIVVGIVAGALAIAQFFVPNMGAPVRTGVILAAIVIGLYASFTWRKRWPLILALTTIIVFSVSWIVATQPSAAQRYVSEYLNETKTANIWYGQTAMNPFAEGFMLKHYSAFNPRSIAYPYNLSGAVPIELERLVRAVPLGGMGETPVITMGQIGSVSFVGIEPGPIGDPEYVVQLLPITPALSKEWRPRDFGESQMVDCSGSLADLYPTQVENQDNDNIDVYVRIHPLPIPIPQPGDAMVVRGFPIAYGLVPVANGHLFTTLYLAGSSATIYPSGFAL